MNKYIVGCSILVLLFVYFYKQNETQSENMTKSIQKTNSIKKKAHLTLTPEPTRSTTSEQQSAYPDKKLSCVEKVYLNHPKSEKYTEQIRPKLNAVVGSWYYEENNDLDLSQIKETSTSGKFLLALAHANHIRGSKNYKNADLKKSLSLLHEVIAEDPTNSAPLIFAASIYTQHGYTKEAQDLIQKISNTTRFDSYLKTLITTLYKDVQTSSEYVSASYVWAGAPIPNYKAITELKLDVANTSILGNQMVQDGLKSGKESIETEWVAVEYAYGKKILKDIKQGQEYPAFQDLYKQKTNQFGSLASRYDDENCDQNILETMVTRIGNFYNSR